MPVVAIELTVFTVCHTKLTFPLDHRIEDLSYAAFAFGYFEDDVQFTSTSAASCCASPQIIEYLHSVIIAGE